jgi:hypothetical protein
MLTRPIVFLLQKKAKVYLKIADIDIGGTRRTAFHLRQIWCRCEFHVLFYINTHACGQFFRSFL